MPNTETSSSTLLTSSFLTVSENHIIPYSSASVYLDTSMAERLTRVPRVQGYKFQISDWPNLTEHCKRFATASIV